MQEVSPIAQEACLMVVKRGQLLYPIPTTRTRWLMPSAIYRFP